MGQDNYLKALLPPAAYKEDIYMQRKVNYSKLLIEKQIVAGVTFYSFTNFESINNL